MIWAWIERVRGMLYGVSRASALPTPSAEGGVPCDLDEDAPASSCCCGSSTASPDGETRSSPQAAALPDTRWVRVLAGIVAVVLLGGLVFGFWWCRGILSAEQWAELVKRHLPAIAGVPIATVLAFSVTMTARALGGPGEVEGWGIRIGGMATNALCWWLTFLAITIAIRMLW